MPCHASTAALRGRSCRWQCQTLSLFTQCPLNSSWGAWAWKPLLFLWEGPPCSMATSPNGTTESAGKCPCSAPGTRPGLSRSRRGPRELGMQLGYSAPLLSPAEETQEPWVSNEGCFAQSQSAQATTSTRILPRSGSRLQARLGRDGAGFHSPASPMHSPLQWRAWQAEERRQREGEQEESSRSVAASRALLQD